MGAGVGVGMWLSVCDSVSRERECVGSQIHFMLTPSLPSHLHTLTRSQRSRSNLISPLISTRLAESVSICVSLSGAGR